MTSRQKRLYQLLGNPDDRNFIKNNLVKIEFLGHKVLVHKKVWKYFNMVDIMIEKLKADDEIQYCFDVVQTYCNRQMRGSKNKSLHSWGIAVDINPATNGYYIGWQATEKGRHLWKRDIPLKVIQVFENNGFIWGGRWKTIKDFMHFEIKNEVIN
jgi:hypothetical protein